MNWWAILGAGLLAGATTCAVTQGGLLVGLVTRQKRAASSGQDRVLAPAGARTERIPATGRPPGSSGRAAARRAARAAAAPPVAPPAPAPRGAVVEDLVPVAGFLLGKLLVLTLVGAVLGALGSFVALDARIGGFAQILAAALMVVFGLGAAGVRGFRDIRFTPPASWTRLVRRSTRSQSAFAPFLLGVAVVLIPCGITISMMLLAATAGSAPAGAAVMAVFVLGTAPMFAAYGFLTQRYVNPDSRRVSVALGAVVVLIGLFTFNAGLTALGSPVTAQSVAATVVSSSAAEPAAAAPALVDGVQVLRIDATSGGYSPSRVAARAGVPTKVVFHTDDTYSCIVYTVFPTLGQQLVLPPSGDTEVDLGTLRAGELPISCSMGMYTGTIVVS